MRWVRSVVVLATLALVVPRSAAALAAPQPLDPLAPPSDVTALVAQLSESLVQVQCGSQFATGWSVAVRLSEEAQRKGYRSMIATDAEVMDGCRDRGDRIVEIRHLGNEYTGYVWGWESGEPYISVMTKARIPMLPWDGIARPTEGQWVGLVTSEGGNGASFVEGRVQVVGTRTLITTLDRSPVRIGSPIFDSEGNVLGMMANRSNGISEAGGPELCFSLINCRGSSPVWLIFTIPRVVRAPEATALRGGLRIEWQAPLGVDAEGPVEYYEYRIGQQMWRRTERNVIVLKPLPRGRLVTVEIRAVNFIGPGASIFVRAKPL